MHGAPAQGCLGRSTRSPPGTQTACRCRPAKRSQHVYGRAPPMGGAKQGASCARSDVHHLQVQPSRVHLAHVLMCAACKCSHTNADSQPTSASLSSTSFDAQTHWAAGLTEQAAVRQGH